MAYKIKEVILPPRHSGFLIDRVSGLPVDHFNFGAAKIIGGEIEFVSKQPSLSLFQKGVTWDALVYDQYGWEDGCKERNYRLLIGARVFSTSEARQGSEYRVGEVYIYCKGIYLID